MPGQVPMTPLDPIVNCKANVCFLLDMSGSMSDDAWEAEKAITADAITTIMGPKDDPTPYFVFPSLFANGAVQAYKFAEADTQEVLKPGWFSSMRTSKAHMKSIMAAGQNEGGTDIAGAISFCVVSVACIIICAFGHTASHTLSCLAG